MTVDRKTPPDPLERIVERILKWFQDGLSTTARAILFGVIVGVVLGGSTGVLKVRGVVGWVVVGVVAAMVVTGALFVWRSKTRRERDDLEGQRDALAEVVKGNSKEILEKTEDISRLEAEVASLKAYSATERRSLKGARAAVRNADGDLDYDVDSLVEGNSLRRANDVFTTQLGQGQVGKVEFETGIARREKDRLYVTHASNRHTHAYKKNAPCFASEDEDIQELLDSKAAVDFNGGVSFVRPLDDGDAETERYFFALSTAPLGDAELESLTTHAEIISQTFEMIGRKTFRASDDTAKHTRR